MQKNKGNIIIYQAPDGTTNLDVRLENDTVWLTQAQMVMLFERDQSVISRHINNIFKEGELDKNVVYANFAYTTQHGAMKDKTQTNVVQMYNLDVIISVGYRVKSLRGTQFRNKSRRDNRYITVGAAIAQPTEEDSRVSLKLKSRRDEIIYQ